MCAAGDVGGHDKGPALAGCQCADHPERSLARVTGHGADTGAVEAVPDHLGLEEPDVLYRVAAPPHARP